MSNDDLKALIREKFKEGKRRNEIKEDLIYEGYAEEDVDTAISQIQHEAIKQLPGISSIYRIIEDFETKSKFSTTRWTILLMILCVAILFLLASGLYFFYDPLGTRANARDAERQSDIAKLQTALGYYYQQNQKYPDNLTKLVPEFLSNLPQDPQTGNGYSYKPLDNDANYQLCSDYELQSTQCVNASNSDSSIPIVPTDTPEAPFVPQSASSGQSSSSGGIQ